MTLDSGRQAASQARGETIPAPAKRTGGGAAQTTQCAKTITERRVFGGHQHYRPLSPSPVNSTTPTAPTDQYL